jgi:hypothetical protein
MWGWIKKAVSAAGDWVKKNQNTILATAAAIGVGVGVAALVVLTGGTGSILVAAIAGGLGGGAGAATGYVVQQKLDKKPIDGAALVKTSVVGVGLGLATGGAGEWLLPAAQKGVTPIVSKLALKEATEEKVVENTARALLGGTLAGDSQIAKNVANGDTWNEGVIQAAAKGAALAPVKKALKNKVGAALAPLKPAIARAAQNAVAALPPQTSSFALAGAAVTASVAVGGAVLETGPPPRREGFAQVIAGEAAADGSPGPSNGSSARPSILDQPLGEDAPPVSGASPTATVSSPLAATPASEPSPSSTLSPTARALWNTPFGDATDLAGPFPPEPAVEPSGPAPASDSGGNDLLEEPSPSKPSGPPPAPRLSTYRSDPAVDADWRGTGRTLREAIDEAFRRTGISRDRFVATAFARSSSGRSAPVEWRARGGAGVSIELPREATSSSSDTPDAAHVAWQTAGKKSVTGHILLDGVPYGRPKTP